MDKKTMTAAELAAQKELESKKAAERAAKKEARKEAIKKRMSLLEKADPKTVTTEAKSVLELIEGNVADAISEAFDEADMSDTVDRLDEITEALEKIDKVLEDADLKNFKADISMKLLKMRGELEKTKGSGGFNGRKSISDMVEEKADNIKGLQGKQSGSVEVVVKMGKKDTPDFIGRNPNTNFAGTDHEPNVLNNTVLPGVVTIVHPTSRILEHVRTQTISNPSIFIVNEVVGKKGGDFEWTKEGALKPYVDFEFKVESVTARKIAAFSKTSKEMLADVPFMQSETTRIITGKYERKLANEVLRGDGVGDESINGVLHYASDYAQQCLNGKVVNPGLSEVLFATATQIRNMGFEGTLTAFVNPCDWAAEMMRKNNNGELLKINELLEGITIVPTGEMTPDEYFIGDMSVYTLYVYENFTINYGYENDDFRRNLISLVAESRMYGFVPMNHYGALVGDSIANVAGLIAK